MTLTSAWKHGSVVEVDVVALAGRTTMELDGRALALTPVREEFLQFAAPWKQDTRVLVPFVKLLLFSYQASLFAHRHEGGSEIIVAYLLVCQPASQQKI